MAEKNEKRVLSRGKYLQLVENGGWEWVERVKARPGVKAALAMPDKTNPALRTFSGHAR